MEAGVVEEPLVVGQADPGDGAPAEPGVGEAEPEPVEERIDAEGGEEEQAGRQEEVGGQPAGPPAATAGGRRGGRRDPPEGLKRAER